MNGSPMDQPPLVPCAATSAREAQDLAAREVRTLRAISTRMAVDLQTIAGCDQKLRALLPHLSAAANAEITGLLDGTNQQLASVFRALLNPADEPA